MPKTPAIVYEMSTLLLRWFEHLGKRWLGENNGKVTGRKICVACFETIVSSFFAQKCQRTYPSMWQGEALKKYEVCSSIAQQVFLSLAF